ncbi:Hypothetical predicted protein [Podarcis lilfordi]|uniref:Uncharacterized protein n=1 Tax=Podarcis lilfordi TaxID=74358 RepID=A0AA35P4A5_9SAUR|nr:Hypothetical predicted protein [Podarcis lilfordi]
MQATQLQLGVYVEIAGKGLRSDLCSLELESNCSPPVSPNRLQISHIGDHRSQDIQLTEMILTCFIFAMTYNHAFGGHKKQQSSQEQHFTLCPKNAVLLEGRI